MVLALLLQKFQCFYNYYDPHKGYICLFLKYLLLRQLVFEMDFHKILLNTLLNFGIVMRNLAVSGNLLTPTWAKEFN